MPGLADLLLSDGSIETLDSGAAWRLRDAESLEEQGRTCGAAYLFGYLVEMRVVAACFRILQYPAPTIIRRAEREALEKDARTLKMMTSQPHDLAGWARYLVYIRQREMNGYRRVFRDELIARAEEAYANWRPRLRYRAIAPTRAQFDLIKNSAEWFDAHYNELWS